MSISDTGPAIDAVCAALRGTPDVWRQLNGPAERSRFLAAAIEHRVRPLVGSRLRQSGEIESWPVDIRRSLFVAERAEAALEIARRQSLCRLLQSFASANVPVLVFKGAALAYSLYPAPWLRPREDTDMLVWPDDVGRAGKVLAEVGYQLVVRQSGRFVSNQRLYVRCDAAGRRDAYDLHWKIADPVPFADLLSADDLFRDADSVDLGDACAARVPSRIHALLLACWHRVSHHRDRADLLWLYDVHVLADRLSRDDASAVLAIARRTGTGAVCARGLRLAGERFSTVLPPDFVDDLEKSDGPAATRTASYLRADARLIDLLAADLKALPGWRARARLLREHLFPPADYMFETYGRSRRLLLPVLYLWRIAGGAGRWLRRPEARTPDQS